MSAAWFALPFTSLAARFLVLLLGASLKGSLIFAVVFGATRLMRDSLPRMRCLLWVGALASFLLILLLSPLSPSLLPSPRQAPAVADGLYGAVSDVLLPQELNVRTEAIGSSPAALATVYPRGPSWALPLLLLWLAGASASLLRVAVGGVQVRLLAVEARRCSAPGPAAKRERLAGRLALEAGICRRVRVLESPSCRVPFAWGILHPLVMLPSVTRGWRPKRIEAVLLHEIRHIKRMDFLTQRIAHGICSLFWFVPCAWMSYSRLCAEQEKCCDAAVVAYGVPVRDYVASLLTAARSIQEPIPFASLHFPSWRKEILMDRIRSIIEGRRVRNRRQGIFLLAAFVVCVFLLLGGAGGERALPVSQAYDRFIGTWANEAYPGDIYQPEVRIFRTGYVGVDRLFTAVDLTWAIVIRKAWSDSRGGTCCQFSWIYTNGWEAGESWRRGVGLMRVDRTGKIWEANLRWGPDGNFYPGRIDPEASQYWNRYFIYYRREEAE